MSCIGHPFTISTDKKRNALNGKNVWQKPTSFSFGLTIPLPPTTRWEYLLNGLIYTCRDIVHPLPPSDTSEITLWPLWGWTFLFYLGTLVEVWEVCRLSFRLLLGIQSQPQQCNKSPKEERPRKRVANRQPQGIRWTMGKWRRPSTTRNRTFFAATKRSIVYWQFIREDIIWFPLYLLHPRRDWDGPPVDREEEPNLSQSFSHNN